MSSHKKLFRLDMIGFSASTICAIHCAIMPILLSLLPLGLFEFATSVYFEIGVIGISIIIGLYTFRDGYLKHHHNPIPIIIFIGGFCIIIAGHFIFGGHDHSESMTDHGVIHFFIVPLGAIFIGVSHFLNIKKMKSCNAKHNSENTSVAVNESTVIETAQI
ncbi:MAG: MerC domain-containing protein [Ignavibacteriaceae bacterium]|nr:MerC domain-containing protein [Ignavibacteria bacterium]MEB2330419.1 MerC domain-containing protein [Ignavibacteriaceae bacterium]